jgi:GWxTD domain-containing protein
LAAERLDPAGLVLPIKWAASELAFGQVELRLALEADLIDDLEILTLDPPRSLVNLQVPWWDDRQWRHHLGWLEGIVDPVEVERLKQVAEPDRAQNWAGVWVAVAASRGVEPVAAERDHMLRIVEADRLFGVYGRGALTDQGKVFVRYGPADRIESHGDDISQVQRWQTWFYFADRLQFTFYDPHGTGEYRLYDSTSF